MKRFFDTVQEKLSHPIVPLWLAGLGGLFYLIQGLVYAHTTVTSLDEGAYLLKGILFARGVYEPFEPYGPLTNKAPFAFLIPGFAEYIFGAGLRTGRYFFLFIGLLTLLGTWQAVRHWGRDWFAAGAVWVFALSPMIIKLHVRTVSQVLIACMLAWVCVLVVRKYSKPWQIIVGSFLAALAVMTRQNMAPILLFVVLYVFWQHGKEKGLLALFTGGLFFLGVHAYYWPHILQIWAPWFPENLTPFLDPFRLPKDAQAVWDPTIDFPNRVNAFYQGIRYHFIPMIGSIFTLFFWRKLKQLESQEAFRAFVFLAVSYFSLWLLHAWASLASEYESYSCVFCFSNYLGFFDPLGILLFVIVFASLKEFPLARWTVIFIIPFVLLTSTGIGFSNFENVTASLTNLHLVPRLRAGQLLPVFISLEDALKYGLNFEPVQIKRAVGAGFGFLLGFITIGIAFFIWRKKKNIFSLTLMNSFLIIGLLLSPILHLGESKLDCRTDIIRDNEIVGDYLASIIPADSLVYWEGGLSFVPMVYVPEARIFPAQINNGYAYRNGGDADVLNRFGYWTSELDSRWRAEADIFIIEAKRYINWKDFLNPQEFQEFPKPTASPACSEGAGLRIFQRIP
jgi:hypothetical protein